MTTSEGIVWVSILKKNTVKTGGIFESKAKVKYWVVVFHLIAIHLVLSVQMRENLDYWLMP